VIEFAATTSSLATRLSLSACARAQSEGLAQLGQVPWCAFVDPSASLYAPGVAECGVQLERLLVVEPPLQAFSRVALRLVESHAFALVVIDTFGVNGKRTDLALGKWPRVIRRLSMAIRKPW
jgi:recombination protein RecA